MSPEETSILTSIKKLLQLPEEVTEYDADLMVHINAAFATLTQVGVGPSGGFFVESEEQLWNTYTTDPRLLHPAKSYVYFKTKLAFDPPGTSFGINAIESQLKELEWRLNVQAETKEVIPLGGD